MSETLPKGGKQHENGEKPLAESGEQHSDVPAFNPELAKTLRAEHAERAQAEKASGIDIKDSAVRMDLNRGQYNSYLHRQQFLKSQFPDLKSAPDGIQREMLALTSLKTCLEHGVTGHLHGAHEKTGEDGVTVAIDGFQAKKYDDELSSLLKLQEQNSEFIDTKAEAAFEVPKIDMKELEERLEQATNEKECLALNSESIALEESADLDTVFALRQFGNLISKKLQTLERDRVQKEAEQLDHAVEDNEKALKTAQSNYQKAGFFKKIGMKIRGEANFRNLQEQVTASKHAASAYRRSREYKQVFGEK